MMFVHKVHKGDGSFCVLFVYDHIQPMWISKDLELCFQNRGDVPPIISNLSRSRLRSCSCFFESQKCQGTRP